MEPVARYIRRSGFFQRRRDLLAHGYTDWHLKVALTHKRIFRVRQGWYSVPDAPEAGVRAVRVGGELTGIAALESLGFRIPRRPRVDIVVAANACRLRQPLDRRKRLDAQTGPRVHWRAERRLTRPDPLSWRTSAADALLHVIVTEGRDVAVACASAVARELRWSPADIADVFARAPGRARCWAMLVDPRDEAHGETWARLWLYDAGVPWEPQVRVPGVGRLDGKVAPRVYVEVDGGQHDPEWSGEGKSTYENDVYRDIRLAVRGGETIRITYAMLDRWRGGARWALCLAAIKRSIADDLELEARRAVHPMPRRFRDGLRKRRKQSPIDRSNPPP